MTLDSPDAAAEHYRYFEATRGHSHTYVLPALRRALASHLAPGARVFDIGAGNGYAANQIASWGYVVEGIEPSPEGVAIAEKHFPEAHVRQGSAYDDFTSCAGRYDAVVSLEVIEHLYAPRKLAAAALTLLKENGIFVVSTPFHGYIKNLVLALTGKLDGHFTALWDHGHIKFFSEATLRTLLAEAGFSVANIDRVGRMPALAKSMVVTARKPAGGSPAAVADVR